MAEGGTEWLASVEALAAKHQSESVGEDGSLAAALRRIVAELYDLAMRAPPGTRHQAARRFGETELLEAAEPQTRRLLEEDFGWPTVAFDDDDDAFRCVMAQLRATDAALDEIAGFGLPSVDTSEEWRVTIPVHEGAAGREYFVIPLPRARLRPISRSAPFGRRGLVHHRVIPTQIGELTVTVHRGSMRADDEAETRLAAGLLRDFDIADPAFEAIEGPFVVRRVTCSGHATTVAKHVDDARQNACFALVLPELGVPDGLRETIIRDLRDRADDADGALEIVVLGSWHEPIAGGYVNRSHVVNGLGERLLVYDKVLSFEVAGASEDILPGREIPILLTTRGAVGFAICRDFLDHFEYLLDGLHLDYVLVPSLSGETALYSHRQRARSLFDRYETRTVVAQQAFPRSPEGGYGWTLHHFARDSDWRVVEGHEIFIVQASGR